jgi:integrase
MARKRKGELPSGNIRRQVYDYTDENGKKHYKSFTAPTKAEVNAMVEDWKKNRRDLKEELTVSEAVERYINLKAGVLSPSTVGGYQCDLRRIKRHRVANIELKTLTSIDLQRFVSEMAIEVSPKTCVNTYTLVCSALNVFLPNFKPQVTMPERKRASVKVPEVDEVQTLIDHCDCLEMKLAIILAAKYTLRRGEICALTFEDINYKTHHISVNKAFVNVERRYWELKSPKTVYSYRDIVVSDDVLAAIKTLDPNRQYILGMNPDQLEHKYQYLKKRAGVNVRFHDLRHHAASVMHAAGIPQRYIEAKGGWRPGSKVLTDIYQHTFEKEMSKVDEIINGTDEYKL